MWSQASKLLVMSLGKELKRDASTFEW